MMRPGPHLLAETLGRTLGTRPVPLTIWRAAQRFARAEDALVPRPRPVLGAELHDRVLADALAETELGLWTFGPRSIDLLAESVARSRPRTVLEFGGGVSTVALAHFGATLEGDFDLLTVEQDEEELARTRSLLDRLPRACRVSMLHAPLRERTLMGRRLSCYDLDFDELDEELRGRSIDMVVIDGPAAEAGARFGTLPLLAGRLAPGAAVLMDDALRDGELDAASDWVRLGLVEADGVVAIEHGVFVGRWRG